MDSPAAEQLLAQPEVTEQAALPVCETPTIPSPEEGVPEGWASAWQGGRRVRGYAVLGSPPTCIEGMPEVHDSAWRPGRHPPSESPSSESKLGCEDSAVATPPNLPTALAAAANEAGKQAHQQISLQWPEMRRSSICVHPSRTPVVDNVAVPAHPIVMNSPGAPADRKAVASREGSISLDGATPDGEDGDEESDRDASLPCWHAPSGLTPAGHANAACSAGQFPADSTDTGGSASEGEQDAGRHPKRGPSEAVEVLRHQASRESFENVPPVMLAAAGGHRQTMASVLETVHDDDFGASGDVRCASQLRPF